MSDMMKPIPGKPLEPDQAAIERQLDALKEAVESAKTSRQENSIAAGLREALDRIHNEVLIQRSYADDRDSQFIEDLALAVDAARERLAQLEGDEGLVERIARTLWFLDAGGWARMTSWEVAEDGTKKYWREQAQGVLAALITTDGEA